MKAQVAGHVAQLLLGKRPYGMVMMCSREEEEEERERGGGVGVLVRSREKEEERVGGGGGLVRLRKEEERKPLIPLRIQLGSGMPGKSKPPLRDGKGVVGGAGGGEKEKEVEGGGGGVGAVTKKAWCWGPERGSRSARESRFVVEGFVGYAKKLAASNMNATTTVANKLEKRQHPHPVSSSSHVVMNGGLQSIDCLSHPSTPSPEELPLPLSCRASLQQNVAEASISVKKRLSSRSVRFALDNSVERADLHSTSTPPEKGQKVGAATVCERNGSSSQLVAPLARSKASQAKPGLQFSEWPKISISLSRKEKEEDFMLVKGSKLPQRPKKRPKVVERTIYYCTPGNCLSDITKSRYEVREKKSIRKKPRGLKAMTSTESDSDY